MKKPIPKYPIEKIIDYHEMSHYIEEKCKVNMHVDFWLPVMCEDAEIHNGCSSFIHLSEIECDYYPAKTIEIFKLIKKEFKQYIDSSSSDGIRVWVEW